VQVVDEQGDAGSAVGGAESDVVESAVVAQGDGAAGVDGVVADPVVGGDFDPGGDRFGSGGIGLGRGAPVQCAVGSDGVVVAGEPVELALQSAQGGRRRLGGQPFLLGLVEPFDFAAGLRMVGPGVVEFDPEDTQLNFQGDAALAALFGGEDRTIEFLTDVKPLWWS
jgi:hypothetical protein